MKYVIAALTALSMVACSSAKKTETAQPAAKVPTASAAPAAKTETTTATPATAKKSATGDSTVCKYEDVTREISIVENTDRCVVEYTKDGEKKEIGSGLPKSPICQSVAEKVKSNLEAAGYKCE